MSSLQLGITILGCTGFWTFITRILDKRSNKTKLMIALAQHTIYEICIRAIDNGYITNEELQVVESLYEPYKECGGNGLAKMYVEKIKILPIRIG